MAHIIYSTSPPTDPHLQYRETILHILQKQHPTNRFSIGSKWLFHNQCYFPQMRHISYCHLVPWQVICQTAGSCMTSVIGFLDRFPTENEQIDWRQNSTLKRMMKNLILHVLLNTPKPHREHINLLHAGAFDDVILVKETTQVFQVTGCGPNGFLLLLVYCMVAGTCVLPVGCPHH